MTVIEAINAHFPLGTVTGSFSENGRRFTLTAPFRYEDGETIVDVPIGFVTDFNSVPRGFWNVFPPWEYPEAGVTHDYLYRHPATLTRQQCDAIHRHILEVCGASWRLRRLAYWGIRIGGWKPWAEYRKAER